MLNNTFLVQYSRLLLILLSLCFLLVSCNQDVTNVLDTTANPENAILALHSNCSPSIAEGRYVFSTEECFEGFITNLADQNLDSIEAANNFASFRKYSNGTDEENPLIEDLDFASVLNVSGVVEVQGYVFRIHPEDSSVYVLSRGNELAIKAMSEANNPSELPNGTKVFSFDVDVFSILFDEPKGLFCSEGYAEHDSDSDNSNYCSGGSNDPKFRYCFKVRYYAYGLWFKMYVEFKHKCRSNCDNGTQGGIGDGTDFDVQVIASWKPRCRDAGSYNMLYSTCVGTACDDFPQAGSCFKHTFHASTRALTSYNLTSQTQLLSGCTGTMVETLELHIED